MRITRQGTTLLVQTPAGPEKHGFATDAEAQARAAFVEEAMSWIGTPFRDCADLKGPTGAVDCAMLLTRCAVDSGLLEPFDPRPYAPRHMLHSGEERFLGWVRDALGGREVPEPRLGDVVVWQFGRCFSHGAIFVGNGEVVHAYALPAAYIGQPLYLKFASFNLFDLAAQDLSTLVEYRYTPTGRGYGTGAGGVPAIPSGLTGSDNGADFVLGWAASVAQDNVTAYTLYRASGPDADFGSASPIWSGSALHYVDANVPDGATFTYFLTASNEVGQSAPTPGVSVAAATPVAPTIQVLQIVWSQDAATETAGARVKAQVAGPGGTGLTWWIRWKASSDTNWNEQRMTGLGAAPVTLLTGFVSTNDSVDVGASYSLPGGRPSAWSATGTVSTHPSADNTTITVDTTSLRASVR